MLKDLGEDLTEQNIINRSIKIIGSKGTAKSFEIVNTLFKVIDKIKEERLSSYNAFLKDYLKTDVT